MAQCITIDMTRRSSGNAVMSRLSGAEASMTGRSAGVSLEAIGSGARPSLERLSDVIPRMSARGADPYMFTYCPIDDLASAQGMGGWHDHLGWNDDIGWKD